MSFKTLTLLDAVTETGAGSSVPNGDREITFVAAQTGGTNATVTIEGSVDGGTTWFVLNTFSLTADSGFYEMTGKWPHFRANCTVFNGGTVTVTATK